MSAIKYCASFVFLFLGYLSLQGQGIETYYLLLFSFVCIPLLELVIPPSKSKNVVKNPIVYDLILYLAMPGYIGLFVLFLTTIGEETNMVSIIGKLSAMGLLCGIFGINMAHELGHRKSRFDQLLAQGLLWTTQYTHFFIEHNRGHHKRVGTPDDPATARKGEGLYRFWLRVIIKSYQSAWELEKSRLHRLGKSQWTLKNDMVLYGVTQLILLIVIAGVLGWNVLLLYGLACLIGILLLETINYIEHYGLTRKKITAVSYERVQDVHSWNSDHLLGRTLLFELTRHSHHHANSFIKYPLLESREKSSQLPTGYPGMMLLSMVPPLWFRVMDKKLPVT